MTYGLALNFLGKFLLNIEWVYYFVVYKKCSGPVEFVCSSGLR